eukprot:7339060-Prymnesium_polylepis.1
MFTGRGGKRTCTCDMHHVQPVSIPARRPPKLPSLTLWLWLVRGLNSHTPLSWSRDPRFSA